MNPIRVGIVGANPDRGWGSSVHIPALKHLPGFEIKAVATTRLDSARRTASEHGIEQAFDDAAAMIASPEIDLVVITVKAPLHYKYALMALDAGKHVFCEWPLAANTAQAREMADRAEARGVRAIVGLQARGSPKLRYMRDLIRAGQVGRVISVRLSCTIPTGGARHSEEGLYIIDKENGAGTLGIHGGHALDALQFCVGDFTEVAGLVANQFTEVEIVETGQRVAKTAPDQILVAGRSETGAVVSVSINGGAVADHGVILDVHGELGMLSARTGHQRFNLQMSEITLYGAQAPQIVPTEIAVPAGYDPELIPPGFPADSAYVGASLARATHVNVANLYLELEQAIREGRDPTPDFRHGVQLHRLLDTLEASSRNLTRVHAD